MTATRINQTAYGMLSNMSSSLNLTTSAQTLALKNFTGVGCSKSSNGIKVAESGTYLIAGQAYLQTGYNASDLVHVLCAVGSTAVAETIIRAPSASPYEVVTVGPVITALAAGDTVYLRAYNQTSARGAIIDRDASDNLAVVKIA